MPERKILLVVGAIAAIMVAVLLLRGGGEDADADRGTARVEADAEDEVGEGSELIRPEISIPSFTGDLDEMRERKLVRVLVTPSMTDFFSLNGRLLGLQAELAYQYQDHLNDGLTRRDLHLRVVFIPVPFDELIPALLDGRGDIAAGLLTMTEERRAQVAFISGERMTASELLVSARGAPDLERIEDLSGRRVYVLAGSSYAEHLRVLNGQLADQGLAGVEIVEADPELRSEDIMELVNAGVVQYTVVDDYKAELWANVFTELEVHEELSLADDLTLGWAVRPDNPLLIEDLADFSRSVRRGTLLGNVLFNRYLQDTRFIENPIDEEDRERFQRFAALFQQYGEMYEFDWLALVAQAYQESQLDHSRRSHAGAVGIMQVRPTTALDRNVNIENYEELEGNIHAGAKYMAFIRDRYFPSESFELTDQMAFSWAAYNAGPARVRRMRQRAEEMGLDPDVWFGNVEYAALDIVGQETVRYVSNIYKYYVAYTLMQRWGAGPVSEGPADG